MHARVATYQVKPGQMEARLRHQREVTAPALRNVPGIQGVLVLVDPASHKNVTISFWDTEANMRAFERNEEQQATLPIRHFAAGGSKVEQFEVGHSE